MKKILFLLIALFIAFSTPSEAAFPVTFANLAGGDQSLSLFDTMFGVVGTMGQVMCSASGTNTITLTPIVNMPIISVYTNYREFGFVAANNSTGGVSINISSVGSLPLYLSDGATQASTGSLIAGAYYQIIYNSSLNGGSGGFQLLANLSASAITAVNVQTFTNSGTYTPSAGTVYAIVEMVGGGGGGGGASGGSTAGAGGAGGGIVAELTIAQIGASQAITVGAGGAGGAAANGRAGGTTSIGSLLSCTGGSGGNSSGGTGGSGGIGTVTTGTAIKIINGQTGPSVVNGSGFGAVGGNSMMGLGGIGGIGTGVTNGGTATGYGAGGGAGNSTGMSTGGSGTPGIVIISEYIN